LAAVVEVGEHVVAFADAAEKIDNSRAKIIESMPARCTRECGSHRIEIVYSEARFSKVSGGV
jgi:hypothetical protein